MPTPIVKVGDDSGASAADTVAVAGVILPASAYADPDFVNFSINTTDWTHALERDIQRAEFVIMREDIVSRLFIRPGTNEITVPFIMLPHETVAVFRYIDYLTIVTTDIFIKAEANENISIGIIRRN